MNYLKLKEKFTKLTKDQYRGVYKTLKEYVNIYGGGLAIAASPYFHVAFVIAVLAIVFMGEDYVWYDTVINVTPDILGFTFAGFAILLTFGEDVKEIICGGENGESSPFMDNIVAITHFLVLQSLSLCCALVSEMFTLKSGVFAFIGILLFMYAITTVLAAILATFRIAKYVDQIVEPPPDQK